MADTITSETSRRGFLAALGTRARRGLAVTDGTLFTITEPTDDPPTLYVLEAA